MTNGAEADEAFLYLDCLEIGTSDFDTLIQKAGSDDIGYSVDPISIYLERLPNLKQWKKVNLAISDRSDEISVFYISPEDIERHQLPNWVRGCNSIDIPHPTVQELLYNRSLPSQLVREQKVKSMTLIDFMVEFSISGMHLLKIDTEGSDVKILASFLSVATPDQLPQYLIFESNSLADTHELHVLIAKLILAGYDILSCSTGGGESNTTLRLNTLRMRNRSMISSPRPGYFLAEYPAGYDPCAALHQNELSSAMDYCRSINAGGVTLQNGRFEVRRSGLLSRAQQRESVVSWQLLPRHI